MRRRMQWALALVLDYFKIATPEGCYGLLPMGRSGVPALDVQIEGRHIGLRHCSAIMPNGALVFINPEQTELPSCMIPTQNSPGLYDLLLLTEIFSWKAWGDADPLQVPYRQPFEVPIVRLELQSKREIPAASMPDGIKIAELSIDNLGQATLDANYLPPCAQVAAHANLSGRCRRIQSKWLRAMEDANTILNLARQRAYERNQGAALVSEWLLPIRNFLMAHNYFFNHKLETAEPERVFALGITLAEYASSGLNTSTDRWQLLRHIHSRMENSSAFEAWGDSFIKLLEKTRATRYDPTDLAGMFDILDQILNPLFEIVNALAYDQHYNAHDAIIRTRKSLLPL